MDLADMINNGDEALHRGSVDKSGSGATSSPSLPAEDVDTPKVNKESNQRKQHPPQWARVFRGRANRTRDVKRWQLSETRPELAEIFSDKSGMDDLEQTDAASEDGAEIQESFSEIPKPKSSFDSYKMPPAIASEVGPGGNVSLTGLTASLAGLVPNDDITRVLAGWIFEQVSKITDRTILDSLEVEFKVGIISDESTGMRHRFPSASEAVIDPAYWHQRRLRFKSEVDISHFKALESLMDNIMRNNAPNEFNTINKENLLIRDLSYKVDYEPLNSKSTRIRVSMDDRDRVLACVSKQRIGDHYITLPNSAFDLKMSLSIEHPVDYDAILPQIKSQKALFERNKNRLSWKSQGCQVDLTSVHMNSEAGQPVVIKEAEIETNSELMASILHEYNSKPDKTVSLDKFLEVIRYTVDSARYLVRNI